MIEEIIKTTLIKETDIQSNRNETCIGRDQTEKRFIDKWTDIEKWESNKVETIATIVIHRNVINHIKCKWNIFKS